jgi:hypothetical protein
MTTTSPSLLAAIAASEEKEPAELPRLTTANVFVHTARMAAALDRAFTAFKKLPDTNQKNCNEVLMEISQQCDAASKTAMRLLEANK